MIYYASRTGTKRNLAAFRASGWRILVSARGVLRTEGFPYALDNGAWTSHSRGEPFDDAAFTTAVDLLGAGADWIVCPDIVMGGLESLAMSLRWLPYVLERGRIALIPVQNGMELADLAPHIGPRVGLFVGGDDAFKEQTMAAWCRLARHPDCRAEFLAGVSALTESSAGVRVVAPLVLLTKAEVVTRAGELGIDIEQTWSCYEPNRGRPCGACNACTLRASSLRRD